MTKLQTFPSDNKKGKKEKSKLAPWTKKEKRKKKERYKETKN